MLETTERKQVRFQKGVSGNPSGRPKGSRHKTTLAVEALLEGEGEVITRRAVEAAKAVQATRCFICPRSFRP